MIGRTISQYKIIEKLGEGGMGEVYLAEDVKLRRKAALKFLPKHVTTDREAEERFEREAQAAAGLNHPNIITVYEINRYEDQVYIAMEYVAGETLRERMSGGKGGRSIKLTVDKIIDVTSQICEGLGRAHQAGIVHRDIKPENILINREGRVKILDFGLAKLKGVSKLTKEASTLGTVHYMSPEQAGGEDVDARTDIWSLGVMLYEMLTGELPFKGDFEHAVVYSILNEQPEPVRRLRSGIPDVLEGIVNKALQKNRRDRYQDISGLSADLKKPIEVSSTTAAPQTKGTGGKILLALVALLAICAVIVLFVFGPFKPESPRHEPPVSQQVTFVGDCGTSALSPDGNYVAYTSGPRGSRGIFVKDLRSGSAVNIYTSPRCWIIRWSPDGSSLLFSSFTNDSTMGTFIIPRLGGNPRQVLPTPWGGQDWSPDGSWIADNEPGTKNVNLIELDTGDKISFTLGPDAGEISWLDWCPVRDELLIQADDARRQVLWTVNTDGSDQRILLEKSYDASAPIIAPQWGPRGNAVYYFRFGLRGQEVWDLMKIAVDAESGEIRGSPRVVLNSLQIYGPYMTVSEDGKRMLYTRETKHANIWLVTIEGEGQGLRTTKTQLTASTTWKSKAEISPNGKHVAFAMSEGDASNIYTLPLETTATKQETAAPRQLTFFNSLNDMPVWSPDGKEIAFVSTQGETPKLWRVDFAGGTPRPFENSEVEYFNGDHLAWAPGSDILYRSSGFRNFTILNPQTGQQRPLVNDETIGYIFMPQWDPDGKRVVMFWNRDKQASPSMDIWVKSVEGDSQKIIAEGIYTPIVWSSDGDWIYAGDWSQSQDRPSRRIYKLPVSGGEQEIYIDLPFDNVRSDRVSMTPDGRKVIYSKLETQADVWTVDNFDPEIE